MRRDSQISLQVEALVQIMNQAHGLDISAYDESFLLKSVAKRLSETGSKTMAAYGECLAGNRVEAEGLARSLRIGYSEFFRDPLAFALLEQVVLPSLVAARGTSHPTELRVWSAGCAAGQEAWSVAILLEELNAKRERPVPFRVFATDTSEAELDVARHGAYDSAAVQNVRLKQCRKYFTVAGDSHQIAPALAARVAFSIYDLLDERTASPADSLYGDFDLILCCNLLFYYRPDMRRRILDKLCGALSHGGYFVTGEAERAVLAEQAGLRAVAPPAAVFRKAD